MAAPMPPSVLAHEAAGRYLSVRNQRIFVRSEGDGPPVLLLHGVPASAFLYRKMLPLLAERGLRAVAFDFPGLGLSDKPRGEPYDWHTLAGWVEDIVAALGLDAVHLVVHDIGGPIGFEWLIKHPHRARSLTIMNTLLDVAVFTPPFPMWLYRVPVLRQCVIYTQNTLLFDPLMKRIGIKHPERMSREEVRSYLWLLAHLGGRQTFLDVMAGFDLTEAHSRFLCERLPRLDVPMQMVWGDHEIAIPEHQRRCIRDLLPLRHDHGVDGRHFIQEDQPEACAEHVAVFVQEVEGGR